ncbi:MAG: hypothetical protein JW809_09490 [Pirellulales bacterium]|nr:hypothetical protein [Pirellulales bacterium]
MDVAKKQGLDARRFGPAPWRCVVVFVLATAWPSAWAWAQTDGPSDAETQLPRLSVPSTNADAPAPSTSGSSIGIAPNVLPAEPAPSGAPLQRASEPASTIQLVPPSDPNAPAELEPQPAAPAAPGEATAEPAPLEPIPENHSSAPPVVEAASFNGVTPGVTTMAELENLWGAPIEIRNHQGGVIHRYKVAVFDQIEVTFAAGKVASIVIRLEKAFPAAAVAQQLKLDDVKPVLISNELGDILGQAFPERGVLFAFEQNHEPGKPSMNVTEIVLEPLAADPFLLRAETNLEGNYAANLRDLDEAIKLAPNNARAHWLRARVLAAMDRTDEAFAASSRAMGLEPENARFRVTHAQLLDRIGRHDEAIAQVNAAIEASESRPHVKARAQCVLGDLLSDGPRPDFAAALTAHMAAIKTADPLAIERHPAVRLAAKEVLIDAHLGAAADIAWGQWGEKEKAVARWTERAGAFAEELIANDGGNNEHRFRVATRALAAYAGVKGKLDPTDWASEAIRVGNDLIERTDDPIQKQQFRWELGMALFNTVQIHQLRKENDLALQYGQQTVEYLEAAREGSESSAARDYLLGRLYFRLGAIHALAENNHRAAITWFDKAVPLLGDEPLPNQPASETGRDGETMVSMGVSYWEVGQRDQALALTEKGLTLIKQAVQVGALPRSALAVPYENLAAMQRYLGRPEAAASFQRLADEATAVSAAQNTGIAPRSGATPRPGAAQRPGAGPTTRR